MTSYYYMSKDKKNAIKKHLKNRFTEEELSKIDEMTKFIESKNLLSVDKEEQG